MGSIANGEDQQPWTRDATPKDESAVVQGGGGEVGGDRIWVPTGCAQ